MGIKRVDHFSMPLATPPATMATVSAKNSAAKLILRTTESLTNQTSDRLTQKQQPDNSQANDDHHGDIIDRL